MMADRPPDGYARPPIHLKGPAATTPGGYSPAAIYSLYGFNQITQLNSAGLGLNNYSGYNGNAGAGVTIGIVDAYDDPNIESDLAMFDTQYSLPACTTANGCFTKAFSGGQPNANSGWALEISLDVEWAHAIAPAAKILLVEAPSNSFSNLMGAVTYAASHGASVVSMSWGGGESSSEANNDTVFATAPTGVVFFASSGDSGSGVEYPAASPYVISVGGTTLSISKTGSITETAWSGSGGGQSAYYSWPNYQSSYPIPNDPKGLRGVPDVSYDANPNTGFSVYDSARYQGQTGWWVVGGTSAGSPQWAALYAVADGVRLTNGKSTMLSHAGPTTTSALYSLAAPSSYSTYYRDITSGTNGSCGTLCTASAGYDYVTGLGSPLANSLIPALASQ